MTINFIYLIISLGFELYLINEMSTNLNGQYLWPLLCGNAYLVNKNFVILNYLKIEKLIIV